MCMATRHYNAFQDFFSLSIEIIIFTILKAYDILQAALQNVRPPAMVHFSRDGAIHSTGSNVPSFAKYCFNVLFL